MEKATPTPEHLQLFQEYETLLVATIFGALGYLLIGEFGSAVGICSGYISGIVAHFLLREPEQVYVATTAKSEARRAA